MKKEYKVGCSPITSNIYVGYVKGSMWDERTKKDVTESAPAAVAQHLLQLNEKIEFNYKGEWYQLKVEKVNVQTTRT